MLRMIYISEEIIYIAQQEDESIGSVRPNEALTETVLTKKIDCYSAKFDVFLWKPLTKNFKNTTAL